MPQAARGEAGAVGRAWAVQPEMCPLLASGRFLFQQSKGAATTPHPASRRSPPPTALPSQPVNRLSRHWEQAFWLLRSPLLKTLSPVPSLGSPCAPLELRLYHWAIGDLRTLAEGKDSQPGAPRAAEGGPKRRVWGTGRVKAQGARLRPGQSRARCGQEDSGARSKVVASLKPGWAWGQGALLLGVAGPRGAGRGGVRYSLLDRSEVLAAEPGAPCPPRAGAGTLGDLAGGPAGGDSCCR